jgi:hypothetical protein
MEPDGMFTGAWFFEGLHPPPLCLPVPAFSVRYLLQQEGWPLGYLSQVVGEPASGKSALLAEVMNWHLGYADGRALLLETEAKSADVPIGIIGWTPRFQLKRYQTLEQWTRALHQSIRAAIEGPQSRLCLKT